MYTRGPYQFWWQISYHVHSSILPDANAAMQNVAQCLLSLVMLQNCIAGFHRYRVAVEFGVDLRWDSGGWRRLKWSDLRWAAGGSHR